MSVRESVSVVIPAHDEAGTIGAVVARCAQHTTGLLEIIVVDDGSADATAKVAETAGARVCRLDRNRGKGRALRAGIAEARGELLVFLDGDGQDLPEDIPLLLEALDPSVAMVIGSRFLRAGQFGEGAITPLNRAGTRMLTGVLNALFGTTVTDPIAGFRAVRRAALEGCTLAAERYDIEVDLLLALLEGGQRVVEVPVRREARAFGTTDLSPFRDGTRILWRILAHRVRRKGTARWH
jgi:glycosyltransferase involved in cell wall biosynthesis